MDGERAWITEDSRQLRRPYETDPHYTRLKHRVAFEFIASSGLIEGLGMVAIRLFGAINEQADVVLDLDEPEHSRARALLRLSRALRPLTPRGRPRSTTRRPQGQLVEELRTVALKLFGAVNKWADVALAGDQSEEGRVGALRRLQRALRCLTPRGRPPEITDMDVARDAPGIARMHEQFIRLMAEREAGEPGADAAENAVALIRNARHGDRESRDLVQRYAPDFLGAPLELSPLEVERLLDRLKPIKRPSYWKTFVIRVLAAKYDVRPAAAATAVRKMMHPED